MISNTKFFTVHPLLLFNRNIKIIIILVIKFFNFILYYILISKRLNSNNLKINYLTNKSIPV